MKNNDWNPDLYLKFGKERTQPSIDLVSRIQLESPSAIVDVGCGPGNSTHILAHRFPKAKVVGVDSSESMIAKAKQDYPNQEWQIVDVEADAICGKFDIVFSNATIQWIHNHRELLAKLHNNLNNNGVLAIQVPLFLDMPLGKLIGKIAVDERWKDVTQSINDIFTIHSPSEYYDMLCQNFTSIEMWHTNYYHIMDSHNAILDMMRSTGLKPYLVALQNKSDREDFEAQILEGIKINYPAQQNGKVLFPFKRLFFIAKK